MLFENNSKYSKNLLGSKPPSRQMFQILLQDCTLIKNMFCSIWKNHEKTKKLEHILFKNTLKNFVGSKTTLPPFCREGGFEHRRLLFPGICQMFSGIFRYFPKFVFAWTRIKCNDNESWIGTNNKAGRVVASLKKLFGVFVRVFPGFSSICFCFERE